MDRLQRRPPSWSSYLTALLFAILTVNPAQALHFYLEAGSGSPKCFYEELPKDTLVVGEIINFITSTLVLLSSLNDILEAF